jgi:hypothetical protein
MWMSSPGRVESGPGHGGGQVGARSVLGTESVCEPRLLGVEYRADQGAFWGVRARIRSHLARPPCRLSEGTGPARPPCRRKRARAKQEGRCPAHWGPVQHAPGTPPAASLADPCCPCPLSVAPCPTGPGGVPCCCRFDGIAKATP